MTWTLAVFRSRSQAMDCGARLRREGFTVSLIDTPREIQVGCGLSVILPERELVKAVNIVKHAYYAGFCGFYLLQTEYGRPVSGKLNW